MKLNFTIPQPKLSYDIDIRNGSLVQTESFALGGQRFAIISDETVASLYGRRLQEAFQARGWEAWLFTFPRGEQYKTRQTKALLEDQMFEQGLGRDTCVIALGGGVVTDLAGYIAATYCRGLPHIMAPTSLLAMVDASIGGKVGVDVSYGKNLVGSIYQPKRVLVDPTVLQTLPAQELRNGFVEMIKHGIIMDEKHFQFLEQHFEGLLALDTELLTRAIFDSCAIKQKLVEQDEKEQGIRRLLNFGHTVGHALELLSSYSFAHGEAVAIGMLVEAHMALQLGYLDKTVFERIHDIFRRYQLPLKPPSGVTIQQICDAMVLDKKSVKGQPRFVMINRIGIARSYDGAFCTTVDSQIVEAALAWMLTRLA